MSYPIWKEPKLREYLKDPKLRRWNFYTRTKSEDPKEVDLDNKLYRQAKKQINSKRYFNFNDETNSDDDRVYT